MDSMRLRRWRSAQVRPGLGVEALTCPLASKQRVEHERRQHETKRGTVLGRDRIDIVEYLHPPTAAHVLRYHDGIAGHVLAEMPHHRPCHLILAAAGARADQNCEVLATIEIRDRVSTHGNRRQQA